MIHESGPWKSALASDSVDIERACEKRTDAEDRDGFVERKVMLSAFAMRKLIECGKLSTSFRDQELPVKAYRSSGNPINLLNSHRIDRNYELGEPTTITISVYSLLNQIIHSYVFMLLVEEMDDDEQYAITGFLVTSDRSRSQQLLQVRLSKFVQLMQQAAEDDPATLRAVFDPAKKEYFIWSGTGEPPPDVAEKLQRLSRSSAFSFGSSEGCE